MRPLNQKKALLAVLVVCCLAILIALGSQGGNPVAPIGSPAEMGQSSMDPNDDEGNKNNSNDNRTDDHGPSQEDALSNTPSPNASSSSANDSNSTDDDNNSDEPSNNDDAQPVPEQDSDQQTQNNVAQSINEQPEEELKDVIPKAERFSIPKDAEYDPQVVLLSVNEGMTAQDVADQLASKNINAIDPSSITFVADDLYEVNVRAESSVEDAVNELVQTGVVQDAQPNYVYHVMEDFEQTDAEDTTPNDAEQGEDTPANDEGESDPSANSASNTTTNEEQTNEVTDNPSQEGPTQEPSGEKEDKSEDEAGTEANAEAEDKTDAEAENKAEQDDVNAKSEDEAKEDSTQDNVLPSAATDFVNDPSVGSQWALNSMDADKAWNLPALANAQERVSVAVLDVGFNADHEDLSSNVVATYNSPANSMGNVACPANASSPNHGTHVAGIVAATSNNGKGISGVGNNHLGLVLIRLVRDSEASTGNMYTSDIARGYDFVINNRNTYNIRVVNMSLGSVATSSSFSSDNAILKKVDDAYSKGIVTVAAAGNKMGNTAVPYVCFPGDYKTIVSVINLKNNSSSDPKNVSRSTTSNYNAEGETSKNISAPGNSIYSTYASGYGYLSGTSMASPQVAGVVGLMFAANPNLTAAQAVSELYGNARDIGAIGWDNTYGYGEVDADNAIAAVTEATLDGPEYLAVDDDATYSVQSKYLSDWSFSSSDPSVLEIGDDGSAHALACGVATITATSGSVVCSQEVTVVGPLSGNVFVAINGSSQLSVATPSGAGSLAWRWTSSNSTIASVSSSGVVYGHAVGSVTITANLVADPTVRFSTEVQVYTTIGDTQYGAADNSTFALNTGSGVTVEFYVGAESIDTVSKAWSSSNPDVASVDNLGNVTRKGAGCAIITLKTTYSNGTYTIKAWVVYVYGPIVGSPAVGIGQNTTLAINGIESMPNEIRNGWTWSTSDPSVATVDANGKVLGVGSGQVTISVSKGEGQESFSRNMVVVGSLEGADSVVALQTTPFVMGSSQGLSWTWSSANTGIATVDGSGNVRGVYPGKTTITATLEGNSEISFSKEITVTAIDLAQAGAQATIPQQTFTGSKLTPKPTVKVGSATIAASAGYTIEYGDTVYPNTYTVTIRGKGLYKGSITAPFVIVPKKVAKPKAITGLVYNGKVQTGLASGTGYDRSGTYQTKNAGTYTAKAVLQRGYAWNDGSNDTQSYVWTIGKATLKATYNATIFVGEQPSPTATVTGFVNGETQTTAAGFVAPKANLLSIQLSTPGSYTVTPTGGSATNYVFSYASGVLRVYLKATAPTAKTGLVYNGRTQTGVTSGKGCKLRGTSSATNAGTYTTTAVLESNYLWPDKTTGNKTYRWTIAKQTVTVPKARTGLTYNGNTQTGVSGSSQYNAIGTLSAVNAGTYKVRVSLKSTANYKWSDGSSATKVLTWRIGSVPISKTQVSAIGTQPWTGLPVTPEPRVTWGGRVLVKGTDYELSWANNVAPGYATVTITGKGNFAWSRQERFLVAAPSVRYRTHVQNVGWQNWVADGAMSGTSGQALRLEGIYVLIEGAPVAGGIQYRTHVQNIGWQDWVADGAMSGTSGRALRLEGIQIRLYGRMAELYDVWYRVHAQNVGWMGWACNGEQSGTAGYSRRLEGIQIVVVPKGSGRPDINLGGIQQDVWRPFIQRS